MVKLAIVTVLYKSNDILEGFIKSISIQTYKDYELYLVDNSPSVETKDLLNALLNKYAVTKVFHIENSSNVGAAEGNNVGIKEALKNGNEIILLTNTDILIDDVDLLQKSMQYFSPSDKKIMVPKIYTAGKEKLWMAGAGFSNLLAKGRHYGYEQEDSEKYNVSKYVKYAPTTFMFIKKEVFDKVGLLDEKYFAYFEDADFIYRGNKKGYKIFYWPAVNMEHLEGHTTGGGASVFVLYYTFRNRIYFTKKNLPAYKWFITFPFILFIGFFRLLKYNKLQRKAIINGVKDGFRLRS